MWVSSFSCLLQILANHFFEGFAFLSRLQFIYLSIYLFIYLFKAIWAKILELDSSAGEIGTKYTCKICLFSFLPALILWQWHTEMFLLLRVRKLKLFKSKETSKSTPFLSESIKGNLRRNLQVFFQKLFLINSDSTAMQKTVCLFRVCDIKKANKKRPNGNFW